MKADASLCDSSPGARVSAKGVVSVVEEHVYQSVSG
jgi:hypothetical protein